MVSGRVFALLAELGYEAFYLADGRLKSLGGTDLAVLQNIARAKPLTARARPARGYVNNFFFLHAEDTAARTALTRAVSEGDPSTGLSSGGRRRS